MLPMYNVMLPNVKYPVSWVRHVGEMVSYVKYACTGLWSTMYKGKNNSKQKKNLIDTCFQYTTP